MLLATRADGEVLLQRRPPEGIWGGLWAPPDFESLEAVEHYCGSRLQQARFEQEPLPLLKHGFTHFDLEITPIRVRCHGLAAVMEGAETLWYNARQPARIGLPAPIATLLSHQVTRNPMTRLVQCVLLKQEAPGLDRPPYPGELGKRIFENVSKEGWERWRKHQIMLINEYRLTPIEPKARKFLEAEMEKFFFGAGSAAPKEFVEPDKS